MSEPIQPDYLTVQGAAALLDVHADTIRRMIRAGQLEAVKVGRAIRIPRSALETALEPAAPWAV
jgi:excisionase family DNA binding protein